MSQWYDKSTDINIHHDLICFLQSFYVIFWPLVSLYNETCLTQTPLVGAAFVYRIDRCSQVKLIKDFVHWDFS